MTLEFKEALDQDQAAAQPTESESPLAAAVVGGLRMAGKDLGPDYETRKQLAKRLNCSTRTVDNLQTIGLPYIKLTEKLVRFPRREVDVWLRQQVVKR